MKINKANVIHTVQGKVESVYKARSSGVVFQIWWGQWNTIGSIWLTQSTKKVFLIIQVYLIFCDIVKHLCSVQHLPLLELLYNVHLITHSYH